MAGPVGNGPDWLVIFLDVDGVICTPLSFQLNRLLRLPMERQRFDPVALFWLRRLVEKTGAMLVLSSSWRDGLYYDDPWCRAIIQNLYDRLSRNRTPIADATPILEGGDKGTEIAAWLREHPHRRYIALDDRDCFAQSPEVQRRWIPVADSKGLRRPAYEKALQALTQNR